MMVSEPLLRGMPVCPSPRVTESLVDQLDGTDLFLRDIPMWCSAGVLLDPWEPKILGAVVGLCNGDPRTSIVVPHFAAASCKLVSA